MLVRLGKIFVVIVLVTMLGAHWALLQTVAWTTMLASNLGKESMTQSMTDTFDGRHPCCLCKAIAAEKKAEKKSEAVTATQKLEFPPVAENFILVAPSKFRLMRLANTFTSFPTRQPPTPPPRAHFA